MVLRVYGFKFGVDGLEFRVPRGFGKRFLCPSKPPKKQPSTLPGNPGFGMRGKARGISSTGQRDSEFDFDICLYGLDQQICSLNPQPKNCFEETPQVEGPYTPKTLNLSREAQKEKEHTSSSNWAQVSLFQASAPVTLHSCWDRGQALWHPKMPKP